MNPQSSFHPPTDFCSTGISQGISETQCVTMHIYTNINSGISESIQVTTYPFSWDTRMRPSVGTGLSVSPDCSELISKPLIKTRVVPSSLSCGRSVQHGCCSGDINIGEK
jgi:hypothetical protein